MANNAEIAAKLLRDAADFFRHVGEQNAPIKPQMDHNARAFEAVADMVEVDPTGDFDADGPDDDERDAADGTTARRS